MIENDVDVLKDFVGLLEAKGLSSAQQENVLSQLNQAITLKLISSLDSQLSPEQRVELMSTNPTKIEDLLKFYADKVTDTNVKVALEFSTETVVGKFLEKI